MINQYVEPSTNTYANRTAAKRGERGRGEVRGSAAVKSYVHVHICVLCMYIYRRL